MSQKLSISATWGFPVALLAVCILIAGGGAPARDALAYARVALSNGELWRGVTAHLTHLGWPHLLLNAAGLLGIWWSYARVLRPGRAFALLILCAVGISAGLFVFHPNISTYVGLSGVLHGLLVAAAILSLTESRTAWIEWVVIGGVWTKVAYEMLIGPIPFTQALSGGPVLTASHFYGSLAGSLAGAALADILTFRKPDM